MYMKFEEYTGELENLLNQLLNSRLLSQDDLQNVPSKGIYVLYENSQPIYVGRSNRMRQRLKEHGQAYSTHNSATLAFKLARDDAEASGYDIRQKRSALEQDREFRKLFDLAKQRVANMPFRYIQIEDQVLQTLFEVYAILKLHTYKYNDFKTH